jgi:hypothetical protein
MAEIKSTLDLVLERTKHLSLSDEEKREQQQAELRMRLKGLLLKAQDQSLTIEQVGKELNDLKEKQGPSFQQLLLEVLLDEISLQRDNRLPVIFLRRIGRAQTDKLEALLHDYRQAIQKKAAEAEHSARARLFKSHAVSGPAVVPNLALDQDWQRASQMIRDEFSRLLEKEKGRLAKQG